MGECGASRGVIARVDRPPWECGAVSRPRDNGCPMVDCAKMSVNESSVSSRRTACASARSVRRLERRPVGPEGRPSRCARAADSSSTSITRWSRGPSRSPMQDPAHETAINRPTQVDLSGRFVDWASRCRRGGARDLGGDRAPRGSGGWWGLLLSRLAIVIVVYRAAVTAAR